jgi:hypothetical protein
LNLSIARPTPVVAAVAVAVLFATCRTLQRSRAPLDAELRTDSSEVGVHFGGEVYVAKIGFVFRNTTAGPISLGGCGGPPMPQLEKLVSGSWVAAYYPFYPACRTFPDFVLNAGATYRNSVTVMAAPRGAKTGPQMEVDSVNGVYRLHWIWNEGKGPDSPIQRGPTPRRVEAISNQFRMILR